MERDGRRLLEHFSFAKCEQLGGFHRAEEEPVLAGASKFLVRAQKKGLLKEPLSTFNFTTFFFHFGNLSSLPFQPK